MSKRKLSADKYAQLQKEYDAVAPTAKSFADELSRQLITLLDQQKISLGFAVHLRVKTWESLRGKIERNRAPISSVTELSDLIGLRIVVLFRRDLERVTKIIDGHFTVLQKENTAARLAETQFGYQSIHYLIQLPEGWFAFPTLKGMDGLKAEIQIRTVAQHLSAASSHVLQYKHESGVPSELRRTIHRVSALLETVDLEFERVIEENERYSANVEVAEPDQELDVITLEKLLDSLLPARSKTPEDRTEYGDLLYELRQKSIKTAGELTKLIKKTLPQLLKSDKEIAAMLLEAPDHRTEGYCLEQEDIPRLRKGMFWTHVGLVREAIGY